MWRRFGPVRPTFAGRLMWGGWAVLSLGIGLLLVKLVMSVTWQLAGAVALAGLVMVLIASLLGDLRRRRGR